MIWSGHPISDKPVEVVGRQLPAIPRANLHIPDQVQIHHFQWAAIVHRDLLHLSAPNVPSLCGQTDFRLMDAPLFPAAQDNRRHDAVARQIRILPTHDLRVGG